MSNFAPSPQTFKSLVSRLERLERQNRIWKGAGAAENSFGLKLNNAKRTSQIQFALDHEGNRLISQ